MPYDPGVKVFRCKVQSRQESSSKCAASPYRRIEAALKENGNVFADNSPRVTLYHAPAGPPVATEAPDLETRAVAE